MLTTIYWLTALILLLLLLPLLQCIEKNRYVVDTDYCRIPDPSPYSKESMQDFRLGKYKPCTKLQPLTWVKYNESLGHYVLSINESAYQWHLQIDLELRSPQAAALNCCYMEVERENDNVVNVGQCKRFKGSVQLSNDFDSFLVECYAKDKLIYTNAHATVPERSNLRQRLQQWRSTKEKPHSVLMLGIDTISRLNLMRAMPSTYRYLKLNGWFELAAYNKIAANTLPNLLAFLTGQNLNSVMEHCNPYLIGGLDKCEFIWKLYREVGYVTAFGEDAVSINTFNLRMRGFRESPVDYYLRPYLIAAEQWLDISQQPGQEYQVCLGYEHASEHIYNYALEFARRYRNDSFFGFFWTNTHSHGYRISRTSAMDSYMTKYLKRLVEQGTMNHTIVVLLSDHGTHQLPTRMSSLSWLEERLPFLFIWLPPSLRKAHPEFVQALQVNRQRLSNPYDLHVTLKHILSLSGRNSLEGMGGAQDCPNCQSLLLPLPLNRSCEDVAIGDHWCTCWSYSEYKANSANDKLMAQLAFEYLVDYFHKNVFVRNLYDVQPKTLVGISKGLVAKRNKADDPRISIYRLRLLTQPKNVLFEVTIRVNSSSKEMHVSDISRLGPV
ncbi:uncharacterized protein LOC133841980 [Drosophila sulfurigaster albostrigata]|uniref:uncharacterized protein LOC133841980 n=1 Tax=Drosophila sulfurigaster albostrigata TaxID=89887 RepID=UPI002D21C248|nr:uncharacterized protein LOC133841980 [Drosophila sulfurigaster albostrigata]